MAFLISSLNYCFSFELHYFLPFSSQWIPSRDSLIVIQLPTSLSGLLLLLLLWCRLRRYVWCWIPTFQVPYFLSFWFLQPKYHRELRSTGFHSSLFTFIPLHAHILVNSRKNYLFKSLLSSQNPTFSHILFFREESNAYPTGEPPNLGFITLFGTTFLHCTSWKECSLLQKLAPSFN